MIIYKPYTAKQYADLASYCNANDCIIVDRGEYLEDVQYERPLPTAEEIKEQLLQAIDNLLDNKVKERGYESIKTAVSYAEEPVVPKFQEEGRLARRWRSLVYQKCYQILDDVLDGKRPIPTEEELIAEMPTLDW